MICDLVNSQKCCLRPSEFDLKELPGCQKGRRGLSRPKARKAIEDGLLFASEPAMKFLFFSLFTVMSSLAWAKPGFKPIIASGIRAVVGGDTWRSIVRVSSDAGACTGVIVDSQTVLTAGHCKPRGTLEIYNYVGADVAEPKTYSEGSYHWVTHPQYDDGSDYDLGLLVVSKLPWILNSTTPVTMFSAADEDSLLDQGRSVIHVGNGINSTESPRDGSLYFTFGTSSGLEGSSIVTRSKGGRVCSGDSGGPVFVRSKGHLRLVGIHSAVYLTDDFCGTDVVSSLITAEKHEWILKAAGELKGALSL